jgi:hypothetical protein
MALVTMLNGARQVEESTAPEVPTNPAVLADHMDPMAADHSWRPPRRSLQGSPVLVLVTAESTGFVIWPRLLAHNSPPPRGTDSRAPVTGDAGLLWWCRNLTELTQPRDGSVSEDQELLVTPHQPCTYRQPMRRSGQVGVRYYRAAHLARYLRSPGGGLFRAGQNPGGRIIGAVAAHEH